LLKKLLEHNANKNIVIEIILKQIDDCIKEIQSELENLYQKDGILEHLTEETKDYRKLISDIKLKSE